MNTVHLEIQGMHCDGCVRRVAAALSAVGGARVERVQVGSAEVSYDPALVTEAQIAEAVNRIGFTASPETRKA